MIRTIRYDTWRRFKSDCLDDVFPDGRYQEGLCLFRGQRDCSWKLASSFDRWYNAIAQLKQSDLPDRVALAQSLLDTFRAECRRQRFSGVDPEDDISLAMVGQHHGLPTRLLDWSTSIYVAAFFAFCDVLLEGIRCSEVAVWGLNTSAPIWGRERGVEIIESRQYIDERLFAQGGRFTISRTPSSTLEGYVAHCAEEYPDAETALVQIVMPISEAATAVADLNAMGVNHARLFPGIDGATKAATLRILTGGLPGLHRR